MKTTKVLLSLALFLILNATLAQSNTIQDIRLLINNGAYTDELLVGFWANATDGWDPYDSHKIPVDVKDFPEIYTFAGIEQVVINGLPLLSVGDVKVLTMGYRISNNATMTIKVKELLNLDSGTVVILKDNVLNKEQDLTKIQEYTFTTTPGENNTRFTLVVKRNEVAPPIVIIPSTIDTASNTTVITEPVAPQPVETTTTPDFRVLVSSNRTIEVQLMNLTSKGTKITINSITGRHVLTTSATGNITYLKNPLVKGQYVVTISNKSFSKSTTILVI